MILQRTGLPQTLHQACCE